MSEGTSDRAIRAILAASGPPQIFALHLSEFREVYTKIQQQVPGTPVDILLNGDWAMIQFSRLCNHRIRVSKVRRAGRLSPFAKRRTLTERDFDFASLHSSFYGTRTRFSVWSFVKEEVSTNWISLILTFVVSFFLFQFIAADPGAKDALEKVNELLVTAATLYLSVFVLFTVSQNAEWVKDQHRFREGLTHRFFQVDRMLASFTTVVLVLGILNVILLSMPPVSDVFGLSFSVHKIYFVVSIISSISITILVNCFISLIQYYFRRVRYIFETDMTREVLDRLWSERNAETKD